MADNAAGKPGEAKLRWGLLSTAEINDFLMGPIRTADRSELVAVASRTKKSAEEYARKNSIGKAYGSYEELLDAPDIDVIYNQLPNSMHHEWTVKALEAGKHVLLEKPAVLTLQELDDIERVARRTGKVVFEAVKHVHHTQMGLLQEELASGKWGRLKLIQGWLHGWNGPENEGEDIRFDPELGGGAFWDLGVYPSTFAITVSGEQPPVEVLAVQEVGDTGVDVSMMVQMRFADDVVAQISCSFRAAEREEMFLTFTDAEIHVPEPYRAGYYSKEAQFTIRPRADKGKEEVIKIPALDPFLAEVQQMERCVLDGAPPRVPFSLSRAYLRTTLAIYESAKTGKPVKIE